MITLTLLPPEVITLIGSFCSPADVVNLTMTCSSLSSILTPTIYRCIVVDPVPHTLHEVRTYRNVYVSTGGKRLVPITMIHTIAGIKCLLSTLTRNRWLASKVRSLSVRGNIAMSDIVLIPKIQEVLQNLVNLQEFEWTACPELPPSILCSIHQSKGINSELRSLVVDLASRPGEILPRISFACLKRLHMKPYLGPELLTWIREISLDSAALEDLQLCRYLDTKDEVGSSFTFIGRSDIYRRSLSVPALSIFFDGAVRRKLRTLKLNQIDTSVDDCLKLRQSVDLTELTELQLIGSGQEDEYSHGILKYLIEVAPELKKIDLSWDCSVQTLSEFWKSCANKTENLKITIRKQAQPILNALARTCDNLRYLEIEIHCDFKLADLVALRSLKRLEVIKLPFNHLVSSWEICDSFVDLKLLVLRTQTSHNTSSSHHNWQPRTQSLGLLTGGALLNWDSHFCSQLQSTNVAAISSVSASLEYLVVDGRTTQLKREAPPLETYSW